MISERGGGFAVVVVGASFVCFCCGAGAGGGGFGVGWVWVRRDAAYVEEGDVWDVALGAGWREGVLCLGEVPE